MGMLYSTEKYLRAPFEVPKKSVEDGILLASFPKSGNTWFRFIISNIVNLTDNKYDQVDFHNINSLTPEIRGNRHLTGMHKSDSLPLFMKTHFPYNSYFRGYRSILLVRKPDKTLRSYYNQLTVEKGQVFRGGVDEFLNHWRYGVDAYNDYHKSWKDNATVIIDYDSLRSNPMGEIENAFNKLDLSVATSVIEKAISLSTKEKMRNIRELMGDPNAKNTKHDFVTKDDKNDLGEFSKAQLDFVNNSTLQTYLDIS